MNEKKTWDVIEILEISAIKKYRGNNNHYTVEVGDLITLYSYGKPVAILDKVKKELVYLTRFHNYSNTTIKYVNLLVQEVLGIDQEEATKVVYDWEEVE